MSKLGSGLGGLSNVIINAITSNLPISDATRAELRNFLSGRVTTVTDTEEFSGSLKTLTQDMEAGGLGAEQGSITGEILGALEGGGVVGLAGGLIVYKGAEIISELSTLITGSRPETNARNQSRDATRQISNRGVIHGPLGAAARSVSELNDQIKRAKRAEAKRGIVPEERKFGLRDPPTTRQRKRPISDEPGDGGLQETKDGFTDIPLDDPEEKDPEEKDPQSKERRPRDEGGGESFPPTIVPKPARIPHLLRKPFKTNAPTDETVEERDNPGSNEKEPPVGAGVLRADFKMLGTEFFDKQFAMTPLQTENSEWAEYDFVPILDRKNLIEIDNLLGLKIRMTEPLFLPKFQSRLAPPSIESVMLKRIPMRREIQITQPFKNKFDPADMGRKVEFTDPYNRSVFDSNFKNLKLYNPI